MLKLFTAGTALFFVIALIFATAALGRWLSPWLTSRFGTARASAKPVGLERLGMKRLGMSRTGMSDGTNFMRQIDPRRRLHVTELAGCRFAILTGGPNDVMIPLTPPLHREHES